MLREIALTRQIPGEPARRWFTSLSADLIVWHDAAGSPIGFQFCYGKGVSERAATWMAPDSFSHMKVDDGERGALSYKASPILSEPDDCFDSAQVAARFREESGRLPREIVELVLGKLREYPAE